jgi:hypothetical protein
LPAPIVADIGWPVTEKLRAIEKPAFIRSGVEARAARGRTRSARVAKREDGKTIASFFGKRDDAKESPAKAARITGHGNHHAHAPAGSGKRA